MKTEPPECWATDPQARALRIGTAPDKSILLPLDHSLYSEFQAEDTGQTLRLTFGTHEVTIRGHSLRRIETALQRLELSHLARVSDTYRSLVSEGQPVVKEIVVAESDHSEHRRPLAPQR